MTELITNISAIAVIGLFVFYILKPLTALLVQRLKDKLNGTNGYSRLEGEVNKLKRNHLEDVKRRLDVLEQKQDEFSDTLNNIENRIIRIEVKLEPFLNKKTHP